MKDMEGRSTTLFELDYIEENKNIRCRAKDIHI